MIHDLMSQHMESERKRIADDLSKSKHSNGDETVMMAVSGYLCEIFLNISMHFRNRGMAYTKNNFLSLKDKADTCLFENLPQHHSSSIH